MPLTPFSLGSSSLYATLTAKRVGQSLYAEVVKNNGPYYYVIEEIKGRPILIYSTPKSIKGFNS